jgi:GT2 family glycosyltransferase
MTDSEVRRYDIAVLATGAKARPGETLRVLRARPMPGLRRLFGVGRRDAFPDDIEVAPAERPDGSAVKNAAVGASDAETLVLVSGNVAVAPNDVETLVAELSKRPDTAVAVAELRRENGVVAPLNWRYPSARREMLGRHGMGRRKWAAAEWMPLACAALRRRAAEETGPWSEGYRYHFEDAEWLWRAARKGWRFERFRLDAYHMGAFRSGTLPVDVIQGYEASLNRLAERMLGAHYPMFRTARRLRLAARSFRRSLAARCAHAQSRIAAEAWTARAQSSWYRNGCPPVTVPEDAETEWRWLSLRA